MTMRLIRLVRIAGVAMLLTFLFVQSQRITLAREGETVPGLAMALAAVSSLLLIRAAVTEWTDGPARNFEKDILWGLGLGGVGAMISLFV
jgi:hypothetical protein